MIGWVFGLVIFASLGVVAYVRFKVNKERISAGVSTNYKKIQKSRLPNANLEDTNVLEFVEGGISRDKTDFARDLEKRLYCANWNIGRGVFHLIEVAISFGAVCFSYLFLSTPFVVFSFFIGPILCRGVLDFIVERKAKIFEQDFGQFIMSMVSLLKTGMTPVIAMESSAKALDDGSLVKAEVESLVESLRNGFNEERALSKFADTIYSPTVETFIQIMMVGKKFGGSLADSLERLAASIRKRQAFKMEAKAALGQAKASMWVVFGAFMICLLVLALVLDNFRTAISEGWGRSIFHFVIVLNLVALLIFRHIVRFRL